MSDHSASLVHGGFRLSADTGGMRIAAFSELSSSTAIPSTTVGGDMKIDKATREAVIARIEQRTLSRDEATSWYRHHEISAFDNLTPETLVKRGLADAVISYIDGIDAGVHA